MVGSLRIVEYPFIAITPTSTLLEVVVPVRVPSIGQIELFNIFTRDYYYYYYY